MSAGLLGGCGGVCGGRLIVLDADGLSHHDCGGDDHMMTTRLLALVLGIVAFVSGSPSFPGFLSHEQVIVAATHRVLLP